VVGGLSMAETVGGPPLTGEGMLVGTLQYMSAEQIEGREADTRSDIWAFGRVLYEMLTRTRPFAAQSQAGVIAEILERQPRPVRDLDFRQEYAVSADGQKLLLATAVEGSVTTPITVVTNWTALLNK
jgi:serine/threonine protein kinase